VRGAPWAYGSRPSTRLGAVTGVIPFGPAGVRWRVAVRAVLVTTWDSQKLLGLPCATAPALVQHIISDRGRVQGGRANVGFAGAAVTVAGSSDLRFGSAKYLLVALPFFFFIRRSPESILGYEVFHKASGLALSTEVLRLSELSRLRFYEIIDGAQRPSV